MKSGDQHFRILKGETIVMPGYPSGRTPPDAAAR
jgi:hypothetical protein